MISELYNFQKSYLFQILQNIHEEEFFKNEPNNVNSPGWIVGHLIVEIQDIFNYLETQIEILPTEWFLYFKGGKTTEYSKFINSLTKKDLIDTF